MTAQEKLKILHKVLKEGSSVSSVCRQNKISRKTFYSWKKRYLSAGPRNKTSCLEKRHLRGLRHPRGLRLRFKKEVLRLVTLHPEWGSHKLSKILTLRQSSGLMLSEAEALKVKNIKLGNHGVYTLLKELDLETRKKRKEFVCSYRSPLRLLPEARKRLVEEVVLAGKRINEAATEYKVSRKTLWKWARRYKQAQEAQIELVLALKDQNPTGSSHPRGTPEWLEKKILEHVVRNPEYSTHKLAQIIPKIGNHGIQNVLFRNSLNTFDRRLEYARLHAPVSLVQPVTGWLNRLKTVFETFVPAIAPAPPPFRRFVPQGKLFKPFLVSLASSSILSLAFLLWFSILSGQPTSVKLGLFFASISLSCGTFFFLYSMKYYFTLAVVLSFSRQPQEEGGGLAIGLNGRLNGNQKNGNGGWLARIFGINGSLRGPTSQEVGPPPGGGLQPNLEHIKLKRYPFISVHLPFYNEKKVANRILSACTSFDYPNYEVIVIDDSTDETVEILKGWQNHPKVKIVHRETREGFKGGALRLALSVCDPRTEFVVVFDADFIPYPDTLELFMKYFQVSAGTTDFRGETPANAGSRIAAVAGYQWHVLNKSENWITRGIRSEYAGSYVIERPGQEILGAMKLIHGSVYAVRADILRKFGWGTSITEDFELTLRLYEQGYKVVYTPYVQGPAECVSTIKRLIRQRMRWAEGHSHCVKKMFFRLLSTPNMNLPEKLELLYLSPYYLQAFFFLIGTFSWLLAETVFRARLPFWTSLWGWSLVLTNFFSLPLVNAVGLFLEEAEEKDYLGIFSFIALSYLLVPFQAYASIKGFLESQEGPWFRTPKTGLITDIFTRGRFYRWISGIIPGRQPAPALARNELRYSGVADFNPRPNPYLALATANNRFENFRISKKQARWIGRTFLVALLIFSITLLSVAPTAPYFIKPKEAQAYSFGLLVGPEDQRPENQISEVQESERKPKNQEAETFYGITESLKSLWSKLPEAIDGLKSTIKKPFGQKEENKSFWRKDFHFDETPELTFHFSDQEESKSIFQRFRNFIRRIVYRTPLRLVMTRPDGKIKTNLRTYSTGKEVKAGFKISQTSNGEVKVMISDPSTLKPGAYKLEVTLNQNGKTITQEQNFTWGVLAINFNKSIYLPSETAYIQMATLDDKGEVLCDSDLTLEITDPKGNVDVLSTNTIHRSPECGPGTVTYAPDYFAYYQANQLGTYQVELTAETEDGIRTITDSFKVDDRLAFEVERIGPTRIYPLAEYEMKIKVKANEDFEGKVIEQIPSEFEVENNRDKKEMSWDVSWKEGETYEFSYIFDAPDKSPAFYLLGPLRLRLGQALKLGNRVWGIGYREIFKEERQWQIAADAITTYDFSLCGIDCDTSVDWWSSQDDVDQFPFGGVTGNRNDHVEATDAQYSAIASSNDTRWLTDDPGAGDEILLWNEMKINEAASTISQIDLTFEGYLALTANFSIWVKKTGLAYELDTSWVQVGTVESVTGGVEESFTRSITSNFSDYIGADGMLTWVVYEDVSTEAMNIDYVKAVVIPDSWTGKAYSDDNEATPLSSISICAAVNAGPTTYCDATDAGGVFLIEATNAAAGDQLTFYIDGGTTFGNSITVSDGGDIVTADNLRVYQNHVLVRYEQGLDISIIDMDAYDNDQNPTDMLYNAEISPPTLDVESGYELFVYDGMELDPDGTVTTNGIGGNLQVDDNATGILDTATSTIADDVIVGATGTMYFNANTNVNGGSITNSATGAISTFEGTPTVTMGASGTIGGGGTITFHDLAISTGVTTTISSTITVNGGDLTIATTGSIAYSGTPTVNLDGTGTLGGGTGSITFYILDLGDGTVDTTTLSTNNIIIASGLSVNTNQSFAMGTNSLTIGSTSLAGSGDVTVNGSTSQSASGTVAIKSSGAAASWDGTGTFTVYNLTIGDGVTVLSINNDTTDLAVDVANDFTITASATYSASSSDSFQVGNSFSNSGTFTPNQGTVTMDAQDSGNTLFGTMTGTSSFYHLIFNDGGTTGAWSFSANADVSNNFTITGGSVTAPSGTLAVGGNFANSDIFTHNSGTVSLNAGADTTQQVTGSTDFYTLSATGGDRVIKFGAGQTFTIAANANLTLTGTDCNNLLVIRSTTAGTQFTLTDNTGGTTTLNYLDVQDSLATNALSADNSVDSRNNSNWTMAANACIGASVDDASATGYSFQRKTFHDNANTRTWLFYHDGDEIEIRYSTTYAGTTWNVIEKLGYDTNDFSVWWKNITGTPDVQYVWLAVASGNDILVRQGTLSTTNINWDGTIKTPFDGNSSTDTYAYPYLSLDSSNHLWVGTKYYNGSNHVYKTRRSDAAAGSGWSTMGWDDATQISDDQANANVYGNVVPLNNQDMYATFVKGTELEGCKWVNSVPEWQDSTGASCVGGGGAAAPDYITKLEQQINIIDQGYATTSTSYVPTDNSLGLIKWDGTKYTGEAVYFEAIVGSSTTKSRKRSSVITANLTDGTKYTARLGYNCWRIDPDPYHELAYATLYTEGGAVVSGSLVGVEIGTGAGACPSAGSETTAYIKSARLIVVQSDATAITATETQVEVGNNDTTTATSYELLTDQKVYHWDDDRFSGTTSVYFEATLKVSATANGDAAYAALSSSSTCVTTVTGSEILGSNITWFLSRSANIASNLTDDTDYWVCIKTTATRIGYIANAKIIIDQSDASGLTKTQIVHQYNNTMVSDLDATYTAKDFDNQFNAGNFSGVDFSAYFESTLKTSNAAGAYYARLAVGATVIANTELTGTDTSYVRKRGTNIWNDLPATATDIDVELKNASTYYTYSSTSWLVIQAGDQLGPTNIDNASDFGEMVYAGRQVVRTSTGTLYAVLNDGGSVEVWKSFDGSSWGQQDNADSPTCVTSSAIAVAIDGNNDLHILYRPNAYSLSWIKFTTSNDQFGTPESVHTGVLGDNVYDFSIAIDSNNAPHVAFTFFDDVLITRYVYYRNRTGGTWQTLRTVESTGTTLYADITINEDNIPEISYIKANTTTLMVEVGDVNNATSFTGQAVDTSVNTTLDRYGASIAVDQNGNTWIAYIDSDNYTTLAKHNDGDPWTTWTIDISNSANNVGYEPSIAINGRDIYVFYQEDSTDQKIVYDLYYSGAASPTWLGETVLHTPPSGVDYRDVKAKWAFEWNNFGPNRIDYLFSDGTDVYWSYLDLRRMPVNVDDASDFGGMPGAGRQVVRTSTGTLYAVLNDGGSCEMWKSTDGGNSWEQKDSGTTVTCDSGDQISVAVDSSNTLHVIYQVGASFKYRTFSSDAWGAEENVYTSGNSARYNAIAIDSYDKPHAVLSSQETAEAPAGMSVKYTNRVGASWKAAVTIETNTIAGEVYDNPDIAISEDDTPEISYITTVDNDLTAAVGNQNDATSFSSGGGATYDVDTNVNNLTNVKGTSIAVDSAGNTWIAYIDENGTDDYVALAKHDNAQSDWTLGWTRYTDANIGSEPSIVIDETDIYVFYEDYQDDIVYDKFDSSTWIPTSQTGSAVKIDDASNFGPLAEAGGGQLARTSSGALYTVLGSGNKVGVWKSTNGGTSWAQQDSANAPSANKDGGISTAIDSGDTLHILYTIQDAEPRGYLRYITFSSLTDTYGTEEIVTSVGAATVFMRLGISIDSTDKPHVSFSGGGSIAIKYSNRISGVTGGTWNKTPVTLESVANAGITLTINEDSIPEITYVNYTDADLTAAVGNQNDATSFGTPYDVDTLVNGVLGQRGTSIAVDSNGNTWVAYIDNGTNNYVTLVKHNDGDPWTTWQTPVTNSNVGYEPSIAIIGNVMYVFYQEDSTDQKIVYDRYNGSGWKGETILETPGSGVDYRDAKAKWALYNNNFSSNNIDYLFSDGTDVYWNQLLITQWTAEGVLEMHKSLQDVKARWAASYTTYGIDYLYSDSTDVFYNRLTLTLGGGGAAGSQDAIGTVTAGTATNLSSVVDTTNYYVHLIYVDGSGKVIYDKYTTDWTFTNVELDTGTANRYLTLSYDYNTQDLYAIWIKDGVDTDTDPDDIFYKKGVSPYASANWDVSATEKWASGTDAYSNVTANYSGSGYVFGEWTVGDAAPYHIDWEYIIIPEKVWFLLGLGLLIPRWLRKTRLRRRLPPSQKLRRTGRRARKIYGAKTNL